MEYAIIAAIVIAAGGWVFYPLLRSQHIEGSGSHGPDNREEALQQSKENVYAAIKEMDFDYQMGKLSEDDYQHLKSQYKNKAVEILQSLDNVNQEKEADLEAAIELEVQQFREQYHTGIEEAEDNAPPTTLKFCPQCGGKVLPHSNFCQSCGLSLITSLKEDPA